MNIDGRPMEKGLITFIPVAPTEGPKASGVIEQGRYVIEEDAGPRLGEFLVKIETVPHAIEAMAAGSPHTGDAQRPGQGPQRQERPVVALEYNRDSRLWAVVREDVENRFDYQVKSIRPARRRR